MTYHPRALLQPNPIYASLNRLVYLDFGSHLYGTATPTSDFDYKGVHIPPAREILLQQVRDSVGNKSKKAEGEKNSPGDCEEESFSLGKFLKMAAEGQTVALDMLFAPGHNRHFSSPLWEEIIANRRRLLTSRTAAFLGYCRRQVNKYGVKGSRVKVAEDATQAFAEACQSNPRRLVAEFDGWLRTGGTTEHSSVVMHSIGSTGVMAPFYEMCGRKIAYNATVETAYQICLRVYQEYGQRAHLAKDNLGVDWKAVSHAIRVGYQAIELLTTHHVTFPLPQAAYLIQVKTGQFSFDQCAEHIEELMSQVEYAAAQSTLPETPDMAYIQDLIMTTHAMEVKNSSFGYSGDINDILDALGR